VFHDWTHFDAGLTRPRLGDLERLVEVRHLDLGITASLKRTVVAVCGPFSSWPPTIFPLRPYSSNHWLMRSYAAAMAGFRSRSSGSMVPPNNRTYFI
jgi:hypothetical protein